MINIDYIEVDENIKRVNNDTKEIKNRFIKRNEIFVMNDNNEKRMNIEYERDFKNHLQTKINILDERLIVLQMKYNTGIRKKCFKKELFHNSNFQAFGAHKGAHTNLMT